MVYFSDDEESGGDALEGAEEELPRKTDPVIREPEDVPGREVAEQPAPPAAEADASDPKTMDVSGRTYTKMWYAKGNYVGMRRSWLETGYKKPRQAFTFGLHSGKSREDLEAIAAVVIQKIKEGELKTETQAREYAQQKAPSLKDS